MFHSPESKFTDDDRNGLTSTNSELFVAFAFGLSNDAFGGFGVDDADTEELVSTLIRGRWPGKWLII